MSPYDIPQSSDGWRAIHRAHLTELSRRYDDVFKRFADLDGIVIHSGFAHEKYSRDDQNWPATPTPHFIHWTPFVANPALLIIRPAAKPQLLIERHTSYWEGPGPENDQWDCDSFDLIYVDDLHSVNPPKSHVYIGDERSLRNASAWIGQKEDFVLASLDAIRTCKTSYEIASIRVATAIAIRGHQRTAEVFQSGEPLSELQLHHEYLRITEQTDFDVPYGNIFGLGEHAAILHHVHYDRIKRAGDLSLLADAGATHNGYASDITRTYVRGNGRVAGKFSELIEGVTSLQKKLCEKFQVGIDYQLLHNEAHELLADLMIETNLSTASSSDLVASGATRCFFPHGLGHSLGIQVHDVGMKLRKSAEDNPYLRNTSVIADGQIVTIEPGFYLIPALLDKLRSMSIADTFHWTSIDELRSFGGIRIEDNMLATNSGPVNLTRINHAIP